MKTKLKLKVADEVWIITALLHKERPNAADFSIEEILQRAQRQQLTEELRPGVYVHIIQHCVANRSPSPGRYRMLLETSEGRRRLFRPGDPYHPDREGSKITPLQDELPEEHLFLLLWYREWCAKQAHRGAENDPLLRLRGSGKQLWADEPADKYVERLRESWQ